MENCVTTTVPAVITYFVRLCVVQCTRYKIRDFLNKHIGTDTISCLYSVLAIVHPPRASKVIYVDIDVSLQTCAVSNKPHFRNITLSSYLEFRMTG